MEYGKEYFRWRNNTIDRREWRDILNLAKMLLGSRHVLELGCGTGNLLEFLRDNGYIVVGLDISMYAVRKCREKGLIAIVASAEKPPFRDKAFDIVCSQHLLEHCHDDRTALYHSIRMARRGVIHIVPGHPSNDPTHVRNHYTEDMVRELIKGMLNATYFPDTGKPRDWIIFITLGDGDEPA